MKNQERERVELSTLKKGVTSWNPEGKFTLQQ